MAPMRVIASIDVPALEDILVERVLARPSGGLLDPILAIVPTSRLRAHLERRLLARAPAVVGFHCLTHTALARSALRLALEPEPRVLGAAALSALVEKLVEDLPGPRREYLAEHAGARDALRATLTELREAGIGPGVLAKVPALGDEDHAFLVPLYDRYGAALERLTKDGWTDRAGLVRKALPHVAGFLKAKGIREAIHHGAYELIGIHLELLERAASATELTVLLPAELEGPAFSYAARFVEALRERGARMEPLPPSASPARAGWIRRVGRIHEPARLGPLVPAEASAPRLCIRHVQGPGAELRAAALEALALHSREGMALEEIAIVARTLEPYAPFLESTLGALRIPFTSSATEPLARDPAASALLSLLRVLARDFERRPVIDLLRRQDVGVGERWAGDLDRWDRWSLEARIVSGLDAWRSLERLVERMESPRHAKDDDPDTKKAAHSAASLSVKRLLAALAELEEERQRWARARTHAEHGEYLRDLAARRIVRPTSVSADQALANAKAIADAVEATGAALAGAGMGAARPSLADVEKLAIAAASEGSPIRGRDEGGIRVLDLMQARGLHHRAVIWLGFHAALYPRRPSADPHLSDAARASIRSTTGAPLPDKLAGAEEERLLLAMALASAAEVIGISYQRAKDEGGKEQRSSALREVARMYTGSPDVAALLSDDPGNPFRPEHIPAHPGEEARRLAESPRIGLFPPGEAPAAAATLSRSGTDTARLAAEALSLADASGRAALRSVEVIESFAPGDGSFDGETGIGIESGRVLFPSALERLSRCPLSFFLRDVLRLRELESEPVAHRIEKRLLGQAAHDALARLYQGLWRDGLLVPGSRAPEEALERIGALWREELEEAAGPSHARLRGLFSLLGGEWLESLKRFLEDDVRALAARRPLDLHLEAKFEERIDLGGRGDLICGAYFDRLVQLEAGVAVHDYKTGKTADKVAVKAMLRGLHLQLPLYREVAATRSGLPALAVEAKLLPVGPDAEEEREEASLKDDGKLRDGILETVSVALALGRAGRFPLSGSQDQDVRYCAWCAYRRACRKSHPPTLERLERDPRLADFRDARRKEGKRLTIAEVRADGSAEEGGEP